MKLEQGFGKPMREAKAVLSQAAAWTPWLILGYFAVHFLIRLALSSNLETDEAELVGQTAFALGYGNGHPPLYNWLVAAMLALTGYWPAAVASVKAILLAGSFLLSYDIMRRITGQPLSGLLVVCSFLLLPQIVYKSQITLTHSVLVMFAVLAAMHAVVLIVQHGGWRSFAWLGLAAGIGGLAKYNFFLALAAILIAAASLPLLRQKLLRGRLALSAVVFAALFGPHLAWAFANWQETTSRLYKMERIGDSPLAYDLPFIGIDGLIDVFTSTVAWAGPLLAVWFAVRHFTQREPQASAGLFSHADIFGQFFARTTVIGFGAFALFIALGDKHAVYERYLTPILIPLPFWLALAWPLQGRPRAPVHFARIAGGVAVLMLTAWPLWALFGREQFAYPFQAMTESLRQSVSGPVAVLATQNKYAANIVLRLPGARLWSATDRPGQVALIWHEKRETAPSRLVEKLGKVYAATGPVLVLEHPYENLSGARARLRGQVYARTDEEQTAGAPVLKGTHQAKPR